MFGTDHVAREVSPELRALNQSFATASFNLDGEIIRANAAFTKLVGLELPEVLGSNQRDLLVEFTDAEAETWGRLLSGSACHHRLRMRQGKEGEVWADVRCVPIFDEYGSVSEIVAIARNISAEVI